MKTIKKIYLTLLLFLIPAICFAAYYVDESGYAHYAGAYLSSLTSSSPVLTDTNNKLVSGNIPWANVSKSGSSLADLSTRSASDLNTGSLAEARGGFGEDVSGISAGLLKKTAASTYTSITDSSSNWNSAYGWGNWASAIGSSIQAYNSNLTAINQALTTTSSPTFTAITPSGLTTGYLLYKPAGALASSPVYTDGTSVIIGGTNPGARLDLGKQAVSNQLYVYNNGTNATYGLGATAANGLEIYTSTGLNKMALGTYDQTTFTPQMVIIDGNVGIGTTGPVGPLHIRGATGRYALPAASGSTQSNGLVLRLNDASDDNTVLDIGGDSTVGYWLQVANSQLLSQNWPLLLNPNGGNVGIGASPGEKCTVAGRMRSTTSDIVVESNTRGLILKDTQATPHYWRIKVSTLGALTTTDLGTSLPAE